MTDKFTRYKEGDVPSASHLNDLSTSVEMLMEGKPGSYQSGRVGGPVTQAPPFRQSIVQIVQEDFDLGDAGGDSGVYEIRLRYFDSKTREWATDMGGKPFFLDANATNETFEEDDTCSAMWSEQRGMWLPIKGTSTSGSGGGGTTTCGCCNGFNCISNAQATIGACNVAGDGAGPVYTATVPSWPLFPELQGAWDLPYGQNVTNCGSSSSSSSSSSGSDPCLWSSCLISITRTAPSSSSSSSSSSTVYGTGVYQYTLTMYGTSDEPKGRFQLVLVSGDDVVGA